MLAPIILGECRTLGGVWAGNVLQHWICFTSEVSDHSTQAVHGV